VSVEHHPYVLDALVREPLPYLMKTAEERVSKSLLTLWNRLSKQDEFDDVRKAVIAYHAGLFLQFGATASQTFLWQVLHAPIEQYECVHTLLFDVRDVLVYFAPSPRSFSDDEVRTRAREIYFALLSCVDTLLDERLRMGVLFSEQPPQRQEEITTLMRLLSAVGSALLYLVGGSAQPGKPPAFVLSQQQRRQIFQEWEPLLHLLAYRPHPAIAHDIVGM
jgi:hypothetical protein